MKLQAYVEGAVSKANEELAIERKKVEDTASDVSAVADSVLKSMQNSFQRKINNLKDKAERGHVDINDCLGKDYEDLGNLPQTAYSNVNNCLQMLVTNVLESVDTASIKVGFKIVFFHIRIT